MPVSLLAAELARAAHRGDGARAEGRPVQLAGLEGWAQRLETRADGTSLMIETVTLRGARCIYDWVLLAPTRQRLEQLAPRFEAWWRSFRPGPGERVQASDADDASDADAGGDELDAELGEGEG